MIEFRSRSDELRKRGTIQPSFVPSQLQVMVAILETLEDIRDAISALTPEQRQSPPTEPK